MKTLRKSILLAFVAVFSLAIGLFAAACGGSKITVSYDLGDGSVLTNEVSPGSEMGLPAPTRDGYFFGGWYENAQFTGDGHEGTMTAPEKDTTYYARWLKGYNLTLNLDGGSLGGKTDAQTILVPETGKILEWIGKSAGGTPQRGNLTFGAWLKSDESEITENDVMPSSDLTLKAGFKVGYTVEVYAQKAPRSKEYERSDELSFEGSDYLNRTVDMQDHTFENYVINPEQQNDGLPAVSRLVLNEDASKNAFRIYCDRATFTIVYNVNLPQSGLEYTGKMPNTTFVYGESAQIAKNAYQIKGYRFAGWSSQSAGSNIEYSAGQEVQSGSMMLYAVWDKGIQDVFGSTDYIYFPNRANEPEAILVRGGYEFEGVRGDLAPDMKNFTPNTSGTFVSFRNNSFIAKIMGDFFSLYFEDRAGTYTFYNGYWTKEGNHSNTNITLTLDSFNTATLNENGTQKSGTYEFDPVEKEFVLKIRGSSDKFFTFGVKGEEKYFSYLGKEKGIYQQFIRVGLGNSFYLGTQTFNLDGYGNVTRSVEGYQDQLGTYEEVDMDAITPYAILHFEEFEIYICLSPLTAGEDQSTDNCIQMDDELLGIEFAGDEQGEKLVLDGIGCFTDSALYTEKDGTEHKYDYYVERNFLGMFLHIVDHYDTEVMKVKIDVENKKFSKQAGSTDVYQLLASNGSNNYLGDVWLVLYDEEYKKLEATTKPEGEEDNKTVEYLVEDDKDGEEDKVPEKAMRAEVYMLNRSGEYDLVYKGYTYTTEYRLPAFKAMSWIKGRKDAFYTDFIYGTNSDYAVGPMFYYLLDGYQPIDGEGKALEGYPKQSTIYKMWERTDKTYNDDLWNKRYEGGYFLWNTLFQSSTAYGSGMEGIGSYYVTPEGSVIEGSFDVFNMYGLEAKLLNLDIYGGFTYRDEDNPKDLHTIYFAITMDGGVEVEDDEESKGDDIVDLPTEGEGDDDVKYSGWGAIFRVCENRPMFAQDFKHEVSGGSFSQGYDGMIMSDDGHTAFYFDSIERFQVGTEPFEGTYEYVTEANGYPVYKFTYTDAETAEKSFNFTIECFNPGKGPRAETYYFHIYNPDFDRTYLVEGGGSLKLDGFGSYSLYTDKNGREFEGGYIFEDEEHKRLATYSPTSATGISFDLIFEITGENTVKGQRNEEKQAYFVLFNSAGVFPDGFPQACILFNAEEGSVQITQVGEYIWWTQGEINSYDVYAVGTYVVVDEDEDLFDLTLSLFDWNTQDPTAQNVKWRVRLAEGGYCFVMDMEKVYGSYVDDQNNVYYLDGWGEGCYIDAEGNRLDGVHQLMGSSEDGRYYYGTFLGVEEQPDLLYANVFDTENHTFKITNRPETDWVTYYAEDFGAVEFCQVFAIDNTLIGYWFIDEHDELLIYEFDWEVGFVPISKNRYIKPDFDDPNDYVQYDPNDDERTYYRYNAGTKFTFKGKVEFDAFEGRDDLKEGAKTEITGLTLEFTPDGTALLNAPATLHYKDFDGQNAEDLHYTIVLSHPQTYQNASGYLMVDAYYNDVPFHLDLHYDHNNPDQATFVLHAGGGDILWTDYLQTELPEYVFYNYGRITSGSTVSIGPKTWPFSTWIEKKDDDKYDVDKNMLISGVIYTPNEKGDLITFSAFYEEIFGNEYKDDSGVAKVDDDYVISHDATMAALRGGTVEDWPVYEVLVDGGDDHTYSIWLEKLADSYGNWSSIVYAVSLYQEYDTSKPENGGKTEEVVTVAEDGTQTKEDVHYVYRAWLYCGAYYANFVQRSLYTLDVLEVGKNEKGEETSKSILQGYDGARWYDNVVIMYHANLDTGLPLALYENDKTVNTPAATADEPVAGDGEQGEQGGEQGDDKKVDLYDMILIEFEYDDHRLVKSAHHTKNVKFVIVNSKEDKTTKSHYSISFFIVTDEKNEISGVYLCNGIYHNRQANPDTGVEEDIQTDCLPDAEKRAEQTTGRKHNNEWIFEFVQPTNLTVHLKITEEEGGEEGKKYKCTIEVERGSFDPDAETETKPETQPDEGTETPEE